MAPDPAPPLPVAVTKPTPLAFDLGLLLCSDTNVLSLPARGSDDTIELESKLAATARDGAQALINQLLTACPVTSKTDGVSLTLPAPHTPLPREKPVPEARAQTKWERFAARRGIKPKTREERKNTVYDEETGEWRPRWGRDGVNKKSEEDWLVEVDERKEAERAEKLGKKGRAAAAAAAVDGGGETDARALSRAERKERVRLNERRMKKNAQRGEEAKGVRRKK